jgi:RND family efflux transporter MFP subunit
MNRTVPTFRVPSPRRPEASAFGVAAAAVARSVGAALLAAAAIPAFAAPAAAPLATAPVQVAASAGATAFDGVVQAVRQSVVSAQVAGEVVELAVKPGDRVQAGQLLVRLDARAASQQAGAADAQVQAARAAQENATSELERQKALFAKNYISQAALERAQAQFKATQAEAAAQLAAAGAARTQTGWYVLRAPYAGLVAEVPVVQGDMAMPGRALVTLYDPAALRISASVPQTAAVRLVPGAMVQGELPGLVAAPFAAARWQLLPAVDPATHTQELRIDLPAGLAAAPGTFARALLPAAGTAANGASADPARLSVPARAVLRRAELVAVYVVGPDGRPLLRQVRLGRADGDRVEVLSGVSAGERVALDPAAAARVR